MEEMTGSRPGALAMVCCCAMLCGAAAAAEKAVDGPYFTIKSGAYEIVVGNEARANGIRTLSFEGAPLMPLSGLNGSVFVPAPGKFIGSGHTEGGNEVVESLSLKVDGKNVEIKDGATYEGASIELKKVSRLLNLRVTAEEIISGEGIVSRRLVEAVDDQPVHAINLYQWCWTPKTTEWIAVLDNGETREGTFVDDNGFKLKEDIRWTASYEPETQKGAIMFFPVVIKGKAGQKSCYWDRAKSYHKYYLTADTPSELKKGTVLPAYTQVVKCFAAPKDQWKQAAREVAAKLAESFPAHGDKKATGER